MHNPDTPRSVLGSVSSLLLKPLNFLFRERPEEREVGSAAFLQYFESNHGTTHPQLLDCRWEEALTQSKQQMRPLFVYLHSPLHGDAAGFCSNVLGSTAVTEFVDANMLCWVGSLSSTDGLEAAVWCKASGFPTVGIITPLRYRGALQVVLVAMLQGKFTVDDVMVTMVKITEAYEPVVAESIADNAYRADERELRRQQDEEFDRALAADQQRQQANAELEQQAQEASSADAALAASREEEERRLAQLAQVVLPPEPAAGARVTKIQFGMPRGERLIRRFSYDDPVQLLKQYVNTQGVVADFRLIRSFPTEDLVDLDQTIEQAGLTPSAQVLVTMMLSDEDSDEE
eukprot:TRINITY_DN22558_c0_g1_i1.p1 TRINITY_DN22558_c0_g1~~TRINITY_DN22558_c0_g1_i1.p1  ORF type:complete len:345 (-),score=118.45 TRINITY_DN22558_c0_g1_i1:125-1159(-)